LALRAAMKRMWETRMVILLSKRKRKVSRELSKLASSKLRKRNRESTTTYQVIAPSIEMTETKYLNTVRASLAQTQ
jgi:hypothetical protein